MEKQHLKYIKDLQACFYIEDQDSEKLPSDYGVNDIPLVIQDKLFDEQGQLSEEMDLPPFGTLGDQILVNGTYDPYLEVTESMVRFQNPKRIKCTCLSFRF